MDSFSSPERSWLHCFKISACLEAKIRWTMQIEKRIASADAILQMFLVVQTFADSVPNQNFYTFITDKWQHGARMGYMSRQQSNSDFFKPIQFVSAAVF